MDTTPATIVTRIETGTTRRERCLVCGMYREIPVVEVRERVAGRRGSPTVTTVCQPMCWTCANKHKRGELPPHPFWVRTADDPPARREA